MMRGEVSRAGAPVAGFMAGMAAAEAVALVASGSWWVAVVWLVVAVVMAAVMVALMVVQWRGG